MPFSSQNPEDRIATAISTYCERDNPKMSNFEKKKAFLVAVN
jgi:hypothetical protein